MKKILICLILITLVLISSCGEKDSDHRFYGSGDLGVTLNDDLTFVANLYHGFSVSGTYTETTENGVTTVIYTSDDGIEYIGTISKNILTIPYEWGDAHGHGNTFALQK